LPFVKAFAFGLRFLFGFGCSIGVEAAIKAASLSLARLNAARPIN
tara:strand:+ start:3807 stop:3941 length:135 start_codon:yes stop_codon:yes gene_type:complete